MAVLQVAVAAALRVRSALAKQAGPATEPTPLQAVAVAVAVTAVRRVPGPMVLARRVARAAMERAVRAVAPEVPETAQMPSPESVVAAVAAVAWGCPDALSALQVQVARTVRGIAPTARGAVAGPRATVAVLAQKAEEPVQITAAAAAVLELPAAQVPLAAKASSSLPIPPKGVTTNTTLSMPNNAPRPRRPLDLRRQGHDQERRRLKRAGEHGLSRCGGHEHAASRWRLRPSAQFQWVDAVCEHGSYK